MSRKENFHLHNSKRSTFAVLAIAESKLWKRKSLSVAETHPENGKGPKQRSLGIKVANVAHKKLPSRKQKSNCGGNIIICVAGKDDEGNRTQTKPQHSHTSKRGKKANSIHLLCAFVPLCSRDGCCAFTKSRGTLQLLCCLVGQMSCILQHLPLRCRP